MVAAGSSTIRQKRNRVSGAAAQAAAIANASAAPVPAQNCKDSPGNYRTFCHFDLLAACLKLVPKLRFRLCPEIMARMQKLLGQILRGDADANIPFSGMTQLLRRLGFQERIKGSHHIFWRAEIPEILNLQSSSRKCKPYQVKQVRNVIVNHHLVGEL